MGKRATWDCIRRRLTKILFVLINRQQGKEVENTVYLHLCFLFFFFGAVRPSSPRHVTVLGSPLFLRYSTKKGGKVFDDGYGDASDDN